VLGALTEPLNRARTTARRATLTPLLVRFAVFLCGLVALVVAYPSELIAGRLLAVLVIVAAVPAFAPGGRAATIVAVLVVGGWILDTTWYEEPVVLWRVLTLATTMYLGHTLTALAAVLPSDATVHLDVVTRWLARGFAVVLTSAVLTVVVLSLTAQVAGGTFIVATLVGLAAAVAATALLSWLFRRP
jgi:hypothetical protein